MSKVPVVTPDREKLRELIEHSEWGHVVPFARSLRNPRRHEQALRNIVNGTVTVVSVKFIEQIARKLRVEASAITLTETPEADGEQSEADDEKPEPAPPLKAVA